MTTKTMMSGFNNTRGYFSPLDFEEKEVMITNQQRDTLTDLVIQNINEDEERQRWFSMMDDMTEKEANGAIFDFNW